MRAIHINERQEGPFYPLKPPRDMYHNLRLPLSQRTLDIMKHACFYLA